MLRCLVRAGSKGLASLLSVILASQVAAANVGRFAAARPAPGAALPAPIGVQLEGVLDAYFPADAAPRLSSLRDLSLGLRGEPQPERRAALSLALRALTRRTPAAAKLELERAGVPAPLVERAAAATAALREAAESDPALGAALEELRDEAELHAEPVRLPAVPQGVLDAHAARLLELFKAPARRGLSAEGDFAPAAPKTAAADAPIVPAAKKIAEMRRLAETEPGRAAALAAGNLLDRSERRIEVRLAALRVLEGLDPSASAGPLTTLAGTADENWYLRREAARDLGLMGGLLDGAKDEAVRVLKSAYMDSNASLRLMAGWALARLGLDPGPEPKHMGDSVKAGIAKRAAPPRPSQPAGPAAPQNNGPRLLKFALFALLGLALFTMMMPSPRPGTPPAQPPAVVQPVDGGAPAASAVPALPQTPESQAIRELREETRRLADATERQNEDLRKAREEAKGSPGMGVLNLLLMIGFPLLILFFMFRMFRGGPGQMANQVTKVQRRTEKPTTRFSDVAGIDEVRTELEEIADFLRDPAGYQAIGGRVPKGVLLEGPPGTGKTLMARALAGETNAAFISISGSDFIELFVGVGAARVRSLFDQARESAPAIIFIDEIDAIGKARGGGAAITGHDEREQTINALLAAMDGFDSSSGVIVVAATNRADILDPALTRPGRFDRRIHVGKPDVLGREAILAIHSRHVRLGPDADLAFIARRTAGLSGAFLENVVNEAALLSKRRKGDRVTAASLDEAVDRATIGAKRNLLLSPELKLRISYHESGHVLANLLGKKPSPVNKVTNIPHGSGALGFAEQGSEEGDVYLLPRSDIEARLVMALGGMAAEELIFGETSTGPGSDLEHATRLARLMVEKLGMGSSLLSVGPDPSNPFGGRGISEATAKRLDEEADKILQEKKAEALDILTRNRDKLEALTAALMEKETLIQDEIEAIARPK